MSEHTESEHLLQAARRWRFIAFMAIIVCIVSIVRLHSHVRWANSRLARIEVEVVAMRKVARDFEAQSDHIAAVAKEAAATLSFSNFETTETARAAVEARQMAKAALGAVRRSEAISEKAQVAATASGAAATKAEAIATELQAATDATIATLAEARNSFVKHADSAQRQAVAAAKAAEAIQNELKVLRTTVLVRMQDALSANDDRIERLAARVSVANAKSIPVPDEARIAAPVARPLDVVVSGSNVTIDFIQGPYPYDNIQINQSNYTGTVAVPKGRVASVKGTADNSVFTIDGRLRGRVINNLKGQNVSWVEK